jgi:hypothetical protein
MDVAENSPRKFGPSINPLNRAGTGSLRRSIATPSKIMKLEKSIIALMSLFQKEISDHLILTSK